MSKVPLYRLLICESRKSQRPLVAWEQASCTQRARLSFGACEVRCWCWPPGNKIPVSLCCAPVAISEDAFARGRESGY